MYFFKYDTEGLTDANEKGIFLNTPWLWNPGKDRNQVLEQVSETYTQSVGEYWL